MRTTVFMRTVGLKLKLYDPLYIRKKVWASVRWVISTETTPKTSWLDATPATFKSTLTGGVLVLVQFLHTGTMLTTATTRSALFSTSRFGAVAEAGTESVRSTTTCPKTTSSTSAATAKESSYHRRTDKDRMPPNGTPAVKATLSLKDPTCRHYHSTSCSSNSYEWVHLRKARSRRSPEQVLFIIAVCSMRPLRTSSSRRPRIIKRFTTVTRHLPTSNIGKPTTNLARSPCCFKIQTRACSTKSSSRRIWKSVQLLVGLLYPRKGAKWQT